jgi:5-methylcytosine-specific restriction enzyme subunit McrC
MQHLTLREYRRTSAVPLTAAQRDTLATDAGVDVRPTIGLRDHYDLTPGSTVGTLVVDGLQVDLRPKIELDRLLFLVSYALDPVRWRDQQVQLDQRDTVVQAMAHQFSGAALRALRRGPLQGYRYVEEALPTVRGRIRIDDQVRDRYGLVPPIEVAYDEFTTDVEENRLLKAAALRVGRLPLTDLRLRRRLGSVVAALEDVTAPRYEPRRLPEVRYTRLNSHYRPAVELAKLILQSASLEVAAAEQLGRAFLVDMNQVFETFLFVALRETMTEAEIAPERRLHLDVGGRVLLKPDLTWLNEGRVSFVGDAKYKALSGSDGRNPDLYQLLAYLVALDLPAGMLIHATGEGEQGRHEVVHLGRELHVDWLDVSGTPEEILGDVAGLADRIRMLIRRPVTRAVLA